MAELEFYLLQRRERDCYDNAVQSGYHQAEPFMKHTGVLNEITGAIARCTAKCQVRPCRGWLYPPASTAKIPEIDGCTGEQYEIEFLPTPVEKAAHDVLIAKWIIRNIAHRHGLIATFAPKLEDGMAGNGMHIHMELRQNDRNIMQEDSGRLSKAARCLIGGLCQYAPTLTAFGNTIASSYLRLVPHQEAPTKIFWSENNRAALIREPLGWAAAGDMAQKINKKQQQGYQAKDGRQTVGTPSSRRQRFDFLAPRRHHHGRRLRLRERTRARQRRALLYSW